jgi:hypothetical protein
MARAAIFAVPLAVAILCFVSVPSGSAFWSRSNPSCTSLEDPVNMAGFPGLKGQELFLLSMTWRTAQPKDLARDVARAYWYSQFAGSSSSYFPFSSPTGCRNTSSWASNTRIPGAVWHIRFWQPNDYVNGTLQAAAHHDFMCWTLPIPKHASDDFWVASGTMRAFLDAYHDYYGQDAFSTYRVLIRAGSAGRHCGHTWVDDGYTYYFLQQPSMIYVLNN